MLKNLIFIAGIVLILIVGGVLEVKIHPDQFKQLPARLLSVVMNIPVQEQALQYAGTAKEWVIKYLARKADVPLPTDSTESSPPPAVAGTKDKSTSTPIPLQF